MSFPASATDPAAPPPALIDLIAAGSLEISPRELHRAEEVAALAGYLQNRQAGNVVGMHLYSFGGAVRTASWMRERISA